MYVPKLKYEKGRWTIVVDGLKMNHFNCGIVLCAEKKNDKEKTLCCFTYELFGIFDAHCKCNTRVKATKRK